MIFKLDIPIYNTDALFIVEPTKEEILEFVTIVADSKSNKMEWLAWLEKQGEKPADARIVWHDVSEEPEEMKELLVEWDSEDATWHEVAFYGATSKTFNVNGKQLEGVTRWCYIDDIVKEQAPKTKWTKEDEAGLGDALWAIERAKTTVKNENEMGNLWYAERWLKSIKKRMEE